MSDNDNAARAAAEEPTLQDTLDDPKYSTEDHQFTLNKAQQLLDMVEDETLDKCLMCQTNGTYWEIMVEHKGDTEKKVAVYTNAMYLIARKPENIFNATNLREIIVAETNKLQVK